MRMPVMAGCGRLPRLFLLAALCALSAACHAARCSCCGVSWQACSRYRFSVTVVATPTGTYRALNLPLAVCSTAQMPLGVHGQSRVTARVLVAAVTVWAPHRGHVPRPVMLRPGRVRPWLRLP